jgi:tetratricopeptide (TPR) repeat protein
MYLSGSKWNLRRKRKRSNPLRIIALLLVIAALVYFWQVYVPAVPTPFIPTPTPTRSPASFVLEAETFFEAGKLQLAAEAYQQAIKIDPRQPAYYIELARVHMYAGNYSAAEAAARDALVLDKDSALAHAFLGWSLDFQAGYAEEGASDMMAQARTELDTAMDLNPNIPEVRAFHAEVLIDSNIDNYEQALEEARAAVALDSQSLEANRALAYVWELTGNRDLALESYEAARNINPNLPRLHIDIGNMLRALNDVDGARQSYLNAVALAPTWTEPLTLLAQLYAGVGEYGIASQYASQAVDLDPGNARLRGNLGRMYYHNGVYDEAIAQFQLAINGGTSPEGVPVEGLKLSGDPRVLEYYYTYGLAMAKQNLCYGPNEAVDILSAILQLAPDDEIAVFNAEEGLVLCGELERTATPESASGAGS